MSQNNVILKVENLSTKFHTENGVIPVVNGVSFHIDKGETIAVLGESGSGKSVTSLSILGLIEPNGEVDGRVLFEGKDLLKTSKSDMRKIRGNEIAMIFQEPLTSLHPLFTVGSQISESIRLHQNLDKKTAKAKSIEIIKKVGIPRADKVFNSYPHSLSGGMRQRIMIAMALSCNPKLLIADEPTTALDVTIQAQILLLMKQLSANYNTSILFITHDLGVVAEMADKVVVMYAGQVIEYTDVFTLFDNPKHPYTKGLLDSTPRINNSEVKLNSIEGTVPSPNNMPKGCNFQPRCPYAIDKCMEKEPILQEVKKDHIIRCWLHEDKEVPL